MCQRNRPLRNFFSYVSTLKVIDYDFQSRPAPGSASTSSQPAVYPKQKPENRDVGQVDLGDRGGCGSCQGWRGTKRGEFRWFPVDTERENENSRIDSCAFLGARIEFQKSCKLKDTAFESLFPIRSLAPEAPTRLAGWF